MEGLFKQQNHHQHITKLVLFKKLILPGPEWPFRVQINWTEGCYIYIYVPKKMIILLKSAWLGWESAVSRRISLVNTSLSNPFRITGTAVGSTVAGLVPTVLVARWFLERLGRIQSFRERPAGFTFVGTKISHLWKRNIIFPGAFKRGYGSYLEGMGIDIQTVEGRIV